MITAASFLAENAHPVFEAITGFVGRQMGRPAQLLADVGLEERHRRLDAGEIQVAFICGWPYVQKHDRPDRPVELLAAPVMQSDRYQGRPIYFTDVVVHRESPFRSFADLRNRSWAYNDVGSHSGYNVPRHHLVALGETAGYFGEVIASGAHQTSIRLVADGLVNASGIDSTVLELELKQHPELAPRVRVVEVMGPSPIPPVVVSRRLPDELKDRLRRVFLTMHRSAEGQAILAEGLIARFIEVWDADYDPIRAMTRRVEAAGFLTLR
ncbi:MAG: PhnD/SsuA/transferrin family substrate-binding protein [Chloroflexi bacterium]|nr:PhnD/SsuA/transferrin family substrate-binding protein [Chloroflexota bacterium]